MISPNISCERIDVNSSDPPIPYSKLMHSSSSLLHVICYHILLPPISTLGIVGNVFNLFVLTGKRVKHSIGRFERSANYGLQALACSDLMISICAFPSSFTVENQEYFTTGFRFYYYCYCKVIINIFIMSSTWLTVILAAERYIAICEPLKSRHLLSLQRTRCAISGVFLGSLAFNSVFLFKMKAQPVCHLRDAETGVNITFYKVSEQDLFDHIICEHFLRALWAILGNFVPLLLLLYFNIRLIMNIRLAFIHRKTMLSFTTLGVPIGGGNAPSPLNDSWAPRSSNINNETRSVGTSLNEGTVPHFPCVVDRHGGQSIRRRPLSISEFPRRQRRDAETSLRITITLVAIVVLFLVLVAPVELVKHILYFSTGGEIMSNAMYNRAETITNTMQALNFSFNFVLYCCIIRSFRRTVYSLLCRRCRRRKSLNLGTFRTKNDLKGNFSQSANRLDRNIQSIHKVELRTFRNI